MTWQIFWMVAEYLGYIAGVVSFMTVAWKFWRKVVHIADVVEQLTPNGGSSIFDKVNETHALVLKLDQRVTRLENKKRWLW